MARQVKRLTARFVQAVQEPGFYADGEGLYLSTQGGGKRWTFIFQWEGKRKEMGLGSARDISLAKARESAAACRRLVADNINPIVARKAERSGNLQADTFGTFAEEYISSVESGWRNQIHRQQWRNSLRDHAIPLKDKPLADIDTDNVLACLQPIWLTKPETARRVRGRIEKILSAAKARGLRSRDSINPAQLRGHLDVLLPKQSRLTRGHHAAMPYAQIPVFMRKLADRPAMAGRALEFLILTAARSGETLGAKWGEIDGNVWTVPADRMKAGVAHSVPLSPAALAVLNSIGKGKADEYIFKGKKPGRPLSGMSMEMLLRRMDVDEFTVHGFRSGFKDWALDCTEFPDEISEEALAHVIGSKVRRAYRRGAALERRRKLMEAWANYLDASPQLSLVEDQAA